MAKGDSGHRRMSAGYPTSTSTPGQESKGLKESAQEMASQAGEAASHLKEQAQEFASGVAGRAQETWRSAREGLQEGWSQLGDRAEDLWGDVTGIIRRYPLASVAIAFGIGCLAAAALTALPRTDDMTERMSRASS